MYKFKAYKDLTVKQNISQLDDKANFTAIHVDEAVSVWNKKCMHYNKNMDNWTTLNTRGAMHHGKMDIVHWTIREFGNHMFTNRLFCFLEHGMSMFKAIRLSILA